MIAGSGDRLWHHKSLQFAVPPTFFQLRQLQPIMQVMNVDITKSLVQFLFSRGIILWFTMPLQERRWLYDLPECSWQTVFIGLVSFSDWVASNVAFVTLGTKLQ